MAALARLGVGLVGAGGLCGAGWGLTFAVERVIDRVWRQEFMSESMWYWLSDSWVLVVFGLLVGGILGALAGVVAGAVSIVVAVVRLRDGWLAGVVPAIAVGTTSRVVGLTCGVVAAVLLTLIWNFLEREVSFLWLVGGPTFIASVASWRVARWALGSVIGGAPRPTTVGSS